MSVQGWNGLERRKAMRQALQLVTVCFAVLLASASLFSQGSSTGRILGAVTDQSGGAIVGATVSVTDTQRGVTRTLVTNAAGEYNAPDLIPGTYSVKAEYKGFKTTEQDNVVIEVGNEYRVDLALQPGEQTEQITVTEALPLVETTSAVLGGTITNQLVGDLPVEGRNFTKLLELRPGVYLSPGSGKWSQTSNGMRAEHNVYILDGVDTIEGFSSQSVINATGVFGDATSILPIDVIQEFNTQENPKAEYGWKPGAIVNVGLRSGTNSLHGTAYAFGRASALDAQNPFIISAAPSFGTKQETSIKDFGATVGGPIKKDKLFFLFGYEGQRNDIGSPSSTIHLPTTADLQALGVSQPTAIMESVLDACNALAASAATRGNISGLSLAMAGLSYAGTPATSCSALSPNTTGVLQSRSTIQYSADPVGDDTLNSGVGKIDYHLNEKNTIAATAFIGNYDSVAPQNNGAAQDYWDTATHARSMVYGVQWTWLPTSTMVNEARFGLNRYNQQSYPADCLGSVPHPDYSYLADFQASTDTAQLSGVGLPANCGFPNISFQSPTNSGLGNSFEKIQGPDKTFLALDNLSYIRGRHTFKVGYELRHLEYIGGTYTGAKGSFAFVAANGFSDLENFLLGQTNPNTPASVLSGNPGRDITEWGHAAFVQDDWRLTNRITLNFGLRWETVTPLTVDGYDKSAGLGLGYFDPNSATGLVQATSSNSIWHRTNNFSPRLGFAWDVRGDSKWVVRGGASLIYIITGFNAFTSQQGVAGISVLGLNFDPTGAQLCQTPASCSTPGNITASQLQVPSTEINWATGVPVVEGSNGLRCDSPINLTAGVGGLAKAPDNKPCPIFTVAPNFGRPSAAQWNFGVQHALTNNMSLQVAYVGTRGIGLFGMNDINAPAPGSAWMVSPTAPSTACTPDTAAQLAAASANINCENASRPYFSKFPYLSNIIQASDQDFSTYNALQATLTGRPDHGLSYLVGYTWAHALSEADGDWNGSSLPRNPADVRDSLGNSGVDVRNRLTVSLTYALPEKQGYHQLLSGWKLNSIVNVQSALPWSVTDSSTILSGEGEGTDTWNFYGNPHNFDGLGAGFAGASPGIPYYSGTNPMNTSPLGACYTQAAALDAGYTPLHPGWTYTNALTRFGCYDLNGAMLLPPAFGTIGTAANGEFRGIGLRLWDASLEKAVRFSERFSGTFRVEIFNVLNMTNYAGPSGAMSTTGSNILGSSSATPDVQISNPSVGSGAPRGMQFGFKLAF